MTRPTLVARSVRYYWRTNLAVTLGVGVAVATLAGALVVGDSVRRSLRDLALSRLGRTDHIVTATALFTDQLALRLASSPAFRAQWAGPAPVLALEGTIAHERSGTRASGVQVFGVDDRFWRFHGVQAVAGPAGRESYLSASLARELGAASGDALLLRVQKPSTIPAALIQARRDEPGRAIRLTAARVLDGSQLGDFSPRLQQGASRTVFVSLDRLQRDLDLLHRANMLLVGVGPGRTEVRRYESQAAGTDVYGGPIGELVRQVEQQADLADLGIRMRSVSAPVLVVESDTGLLVDEFATGVAAATREIGVEPIPVLTYLATAIKANGRETPYSLVAALPEAQLKLRARTNSAAGAGTGRNRDTRSAELQSGQRGPSAGAASNVGAGFSRPIWLTQWTADDLNARAGDAVTLDYYLWSDDAGLITKSADFVVAGVLPMEGLAIDPDLTPEYPGVSTSANIANWDPPFPVDLKRIRPKDEDYWDDYTTAPKAFIRLEDGQALWQSRYGKVSSIRIPRDGRSAPDLHAAYRAALPKHLPARAAGFRAIPVREQALAAASGTTDFGEYFTYFSFFLVVSSLLLTLLFFRLGIEQRAAQVGLFAAMGYAPRAIRGLLLAEGGVLAAVGAAIGAAGAIAYASLIMLALRTWWVGAVGTTDLTLHVSPTPLVAGAAAGIVAGLVFIAWSLRVIRKASARQLMSGAWVDLPPSGGRSARITSPPAC